MTVARRHKDSDVQNEKCTQVLKDVTKEVFGEYHAQIQQQLQTSPSVAGSEFSTTAVGRETASVSGTTLSGTTLVQDPPDGHVGVGGVAVVPPPGGGGDHGNKVSQRHPQLSPVLSTGISMGGGQQVITILI